MAYLFHCGGIPCLIVCFFARLCMLSRLMPIAHSFKAWMPTHIYTFVCAVQTRPRRGIRKMRKKCRNKVANLLFLTHRRKYRQSTGRGVAAVRQLQADTNAPNGVKTTATNETDPFSRYSGQGRCRKRWPKRWWWCKKEALIFLFCTHISFEQNNVPSRGKANDFPPLLHGQGVTLKHAQKTSYSRA